MTLQQSIFALHAPRLTALIFFGVSAACSLAVDQQVTQCETDTDCDRFGNHPTCQQGVCVDSGLGPEGCFYGTPSTPEDFANQCTTSKTYQFDNCLRLGLCDDAMLGAAMLKTLPPADLGPVPPLLTNQPVPTTNCADLPNPIYITGSTNLVPLIKAVQPLLRAGSPSYTAVFAPQTSCKGAAAVYDPDPAKHIIKNITNNGAFHYDAAGNQTFCLLDTAGNLVDVGQSDVYPSSCGYAPIANVADFAGPIQAIVFVVPASSKQTTISAEAAHLTFAVGGDGGKTAPWTNPRFFFIRSSGTGTTQLTSRVIGLDPTKWWGIDRLSATNLAASMESIDPLAAEAVLGVISSDFADKKRANLRALAFQQQGQKYGYLPDSTPSSFDKANVRDGHYPNWGAIHFLVPTVNGVPSVAARALLTRFTLANLDKDLIGAIVDAGFVPACAMKVSRTTEVGPMSTYQPSFGCGCYYDSLVNTASSCKACTTANDCTGSNKACNYGFCEKQ